MEFGVNLGYKCRYQDPPTALNGALVVLNSGYKKKKKSLVRGSNLG